HLTDEDAGFVTAATRRFVETLDAPRVPAEAELREAIAILALPAHDEADEVVLLMLGQSLDPGRFRVTVASPHLLASEVIALVESLEPAAVVIGALAGAGRVLHVRYLCKRLRARFPTLRIVRGSWGGAARRAEDAGPAGGADPLVVTLAEARTRLEELWQLERSAWTSVAAVIRPARGPRPDEPRPAIGP